MAFADTPKYDMIEIDRRARELRAQYTQELFRKFVANLKGMFAKGPKTADAVA